MMRMDALNLSDWSPDFANAANQKFVAEFTKEYKRTPTLYASQGYDAAHRVGTVEIP